MLSSRGSGFDLLTPERAVPNFGQFPHIERMFDTDSGEKKVNAGRRGDIWMRGIGMVFPHNHRIGNNGRQYGGGAD
jgi:hypothetical protein